MCRKLSCLLLRSSFRGVILPPHHHISSVPYSVRSREHYSVVTMSAIEARDAVSFPRPSWSTDVHSRGVSESPYRRLMDPRRILPSSPLSSGHSSPEGNREVSKFRTRSRSLSPQRRHLCSLYGIGHIPLHTSRTAVDSEMSSYGSRKSSVEADGHNLDYTMTMDSTSRQLHMEKLNGWNGGFRTDDWKDEREGLLMEIQECQRRIQVMCPLFTSSLSTCFLLYSLATSEHDMNPIGGCSCNFLVSYVSFPPGK